MKPVLPLLFAHRRVVQSGRVLWQSRERSHSCVAVCFFCVEFFFSFVKSAPQLLATHVRFYFLGVWFVEFCDFQVTDSSLRYDCDQFAPLPMSVCIACLLVRSSALPPRHIATCLSWREIRLRVTTVSFRPSESSTLITFPRHPCAPPSVQEHATALPLKALCLSFFITSLVQNDFFEKKRYLWSFIGHAAYDRSLTLSVHASNYLELAHNPTEIGLYSSAFSFQCALTRRCATSYLVPD